MKTILFSVVLLLVVTFDQSQAHKVKKEKNPRAANGKGKCNQKSACKVLEKELPKLESKVAALAKVDMKLQEQLNAMAKQIKNLAKLVEEGKPTTNKIPTPTNEPTTPTPSSTTTTTTTITETIKKCVNKTIFFNPFFSLTPIHSFLIRCITILFSYTLKIISKRQWINIFYYFQDWNT